MGIWDFLGRKSPIKSQECRKYQGIFYPRDFLEMGCLEMGFLGKQIFIRWIRYLTKKPSLIRTLNINFSIQYFRIFCLNFNCFFRIFGMTRHSFINGRALISQKEAAISIWIKIRWAQLLNPVEEKTTTPDVFEKMNGPICHLHPYLLVKVNVATDRKCSIL